MLFLYWQWLQNIRPHNYILILIWWYWCLLRFYSEVSLCLVIFLLLKMTCEFYNIYYKKIFITVTQWPHLITNTIKISTKVLTLEIGVKMMSVIITLLQDVPIQFIQILTLNYFIKFNQFNIKKITIQLYSR